ncbi:hypothetical protein ACS52_00115 [Bacillus cereus]|nr:hypothetical protein ACS52_00115 [Bacillus cereus]
MGCARTARRDPEAERHRGQRSLFRAGVPVADGVAAHGRVAGGSARRDRPAEHSRHDRRTSELAPASADDARPDRLQGRSRSLEGGDPGTKLGGGALTSGFVRLARHCPQRSKIMR